ncbi:hypothetical protein A9W99_17425 [Mycobacterium sp. 1164966.3]|uniref:hypothetical protein n=1 Tax=Mycobacterium sp. 1164966.3 TaxID=1856861 RepID=UPI000801B428|nr:hypothetical protein [Mycobacterium sp. 1164966.3]OBA80418.1 hypothetical protein A9W99_17425 [Mycobacterium sp. 1164966.3]
MARTEPDPGMLDAVVGGALAGQDSPAALGGIGQGPNPLTTVAVWEMLQRGVSSRRLVAFAAVLAWLLPPTRALWSRWRRFSDDCGRW